VFIYSRGTVRAEVPVVWKSAVGTAGIGWDFPIEPELVLRPIANPAQTTAIFGVGRGM